MKKKSREEKEDELRAEYDLCQLLKKGVQGKYINRYRKGTNLVLLEPDISKAFPDARAVNEVLRLVLELGKFSGGRKKHSARA
ncbi:MAG: hypothetical protein EHM45_20230 [Desulfobacteraceae bacterium]|nr:MAG: hypothetical protein EHM45_20230 [Desulfobacteraceae bacterium]